MSLRKPVFDAEKRAEWKHFIKILAAIAIPVALQNLLSTTASMVDTVMLATLGENTVGAVGLCAQFSSLLFSCYWGFVGGGIMFMSQFWGAKDGKGVCASYGLTLTCMMTMGILFCCLASAFPYTVMNIYTDKKELWEIGVRYLRIVGFAYPLQIVSMAMSAMLRSTERVRIPLIASIASLATNMIANYLLIFGKFGLPKLGVEGAAWGTLISGFVNIAMLVILGKAAGHPFLLKFKEHFSWTAAFVRKYLIKCFPIICNELLIGVGNMVINIVLGRQSTQAIAALAVFRTFEGFVISFFTGFTNAASILVGKEVGAGNHELAFRRAKRLVVLTPIVVGAACLCFLAFRDPILTAMGLSGESFRIAGQLLVAFTVIAMVRMTNWIQNDTYRSAGDPVFGTVMEISFMYAMVLPSICIAGLALDVPFIVVFLCAYIDEPVRVVIMLKHMFSGKWIKPVTQEGQSTIQAFREKHGIKVKAKA